MIYCSDFYHCGVCGAEVSALKDPELLKHTEDAWHPVEEYAEYYHYFGCACGQYYKGWVKHTASCTDPSVCIYCGQTSENYASWITRHKTSADTKYTHNANTHWFTCPDCNTKVEGTHNCKEYKTTTGYHTGVCSQCGQNVKAAHRAACDAPTTCLDCKATGISAASFEHDYDTTVFEHDSNYHWNTCQSCNMKFNKAKHTAWCDNEMECTACGADDVKTVIRHQSGTAYDQEFDYEFSQTNRVWHWHVCYNDGSVMDKEKHTEYCWNPGVCIKCHKGGIKADATEHAVNSPYESNATHHWQVCLECGEVFNKTAHTASCDNKTTCTRCKATGITTDNIQHLVNKKEYQANNTQHWYFCTRCQTKTNVTSHSYNKQNECTKCGYVAGKVTVIAPVKTAFVMGKGETLKVKYSLVGGTGKNKVTFKSSDNSVVSVDNGGVLKAHKPGTATITMICDDAKATVKVTVVVPTVRLNRSGTVILNIGRKYQLTATLSVATENCVLTWRSTKPDVASVDDNGLVTAKKAGSTTIIVKTPGGETAKVTIRVQ